MHLLMELSGPQRTLVIGSTAIAFVIVPLFWHLATRDGNTRRIVPVSVGAHGTYTTNFALTENPVSEGGNWINGRAVAFDWANIRTTPGLAFGTESGTVQYNDSTALLGGTWGSNQTVEATVHSINQSDSIFEEVELRLRSSFLAHRATGYEVNFRCSKTRKAYTQIVRWNGPLGSFTYLTTASGPQYGVANGDLVKATIVGTVITAYINGAQVLQAADSTYSSGSPGMGFYLEGASGVNGDYGFTWFAATDRPSFEHPGEVGRASRTP